MNEKLLKRIFVVTIFLGMLVSTTASGNHLKLSLDSSGPPKFQELQKTLERASSPRKPPTSLPASRTTRDISSYTPSHTKQAINRQKTQTVKPHTKLGWQFLLNGQPQEAMTVYRKVIRQNSKSARAYLGLGISLKRLGKAGLAKKALLKAVNLDPNLPSALVHLGYLYAEGHFGQADLKTARRLFHQASELGDPFASIALLDMKSHPKL